MQLSPNRAYRSSAGAKARARPSYLRHVVTAAVAVGLFAVLNILALLGHVAPNPLITFGLIVAFSWTAVIGCIWLSSRRRPRSRNG